MDQSIVAHAGIQEATARSRTSLTSPGACGEQLFPAPQAQLPAETGGGSEAFSSVKSRFSKRWVCSGKELAWLIVPGL